jgi:hypothetical protein
VNGKVYVFAGRGLGCLCDREENDWEDSPGEWDALLFFGSRLPEMLSVEKMRPSEPSENDGLDQR